MVHRRDSLKIILCGSNRLLLMPGRCTWTVRRELEASPYAAAARATDLSGLPSAYICVGAADLFCDEDIEYARRLDAAGVNVELAVFPGVYHAAESFAPAAKVSKRLKASFMSALGDAFR